MSTKTEIKSGLMESLEGLSQGIQKTSPSWLSDLRRQQWDDFAQKGIPTTRHEEWKYFNLASLNTRRFKLSNSTSVPDETLLKDYLDADEISLVFVNGVFSTKYSVTKNLPKDVTFYAVPQALDKEKSTIQAFLEQTTPNDPEPFVALNNSLYQDGVFLRVADKVIVNQVIHIFYFTTETSNDVVFFPRIFLTVGKSAQVTVIESYVGLTDASYWMNPVVDIQMAENSVLNFCKAQTDGDQALHIGATRVWQAANSQLELFTLAAGCAMNRNNISVTSNGEGTDSIVNGLYVLGGSQVVDNHTLIDHQQPNCTSHQLYKGILNDSSHAIFNGKIFVRQIAQKTNSYQLNKHLVLGKDARIDTKPQLEIFADDVKCTHGATVGQLNEDELFYLQTRAISKDDAIRMLSRGFVEDILGRLRHEEVHHKFSKLLSRKIAILR